MARSSPRTCLYCRGANSPRGCLWCGLPSNSPPEPAQPCVIRVLSGSYPAIMLASKLTPGTIVTIKRNVSKHRVTQNYTIHSSCVIPFNLPLPTTPDVQVEKHLDLTTLFQAGGLPAPSTLVPSILPGIWIPSFLDEANLLQEIAVTLVRRKLLDIETVETRFNKIDKLLALADRAGSEEEAKSAVAFAQRNFDKMLSIELYTH